MFIRRLDCDKFIVPCNNFDLHDRDDNQFTANFDSFSFHRGSERKPSINIISDRLNALTEFLKIENNDILTYNTLLHIISEQCILMSQYNMFCEEIAKLINRWELEKRPTRKVVYLRHIREVLYYEKFHRACSGSSQSMTTQCIIPLMVEGETSMARFEGFFCTEGRENPTGELVMEVSGQETVFINFSKDEEEKKQSLTDFYRLRQMMHMGDELTNDELFDVLRCCLMPLPSIGGDDFKELWRNQLTTMCTLK